MRTKIVYSLVSDSRDHFLEQLLISSYSVKKHNPDAHITLVTDNISNAEITGDRSNALKYIDEKIVVQTPELGKKSRSRWLKTSIRQIVKGDYLFIDTDTIITKSISEVDSLDIKIGAVLDRHLPIDKNQRGDDIIKQCKKSGWEPKEKDFLYFNSGVMLVKDCPEAHNLYNKWHDIWQHSFEHGIDIDQPALGLANRQAGYLIKEIDGTWNCQVLGNGLKYMHSAYILHYYNTDSRTNLHSNPFIFSSRTFQEQIAKDKFILSDALKAKINSSHEQFSDSYELISNEKMDVYNTEAVQFVIRTINKSRFVNLIVSGMAQAINMIMKKSKIKK